MTPVATPDNEALLLAQAKSATGAQLERVCAAFAGVKRKLDPRDHVRDDARYVRRRTCADGMVVIEARLHLDEAEQ